MATSDTKTLIEGAASRFIDEVPALRKLALVSRIDLIERGGTAVWRLEVPGPTATRDAGGDARVEITMDRRAFNQLAEKGHLADWIAAYDKGVVRVNGDPNVLKLLAKVVQLRVAKSR